MEKNAPLQKIENLKEKLFSKILFMFWNQMICYEGNFFPKFREAGYLFYVYKTKNSVFGKMLFMPVSFSLKITK